MNRFKSAIRHRRGPEDTLGLGPSVQSNPSRTPSSSRVPTRDGFDTSSAAQQASPPDPAETSEKGDMLNAPFGSADDVNGLSKLFSRVKTKQKRPALPDNFTKWDGSSRGGRHGRPSLPGKVHSNGSSSSAASAAAAAMATARTRGGAANGDAGDEVYWDAPSSPEQGRVLLDDHEPEEAGLRRTHDLPARKPVGSGSHADPLPSKTKGKGKRSAIGDIDWNEYADPEALQAVLQSYQGEQVFPGISPTDSGVAIEDNDDSVVLGENSKHAKAKVTNLHDSWMTNERKLQQEIQEMNRIWSDKLHALQIQEEQTLERLRQEEEDRKRAEELAEEERLERLRQEEEDRRQAEELAEQERRDLEEALALLAEEQRKAEELARRRECVVCGESLEPSAFPVATANCEHDAQTCSDCMHQWIASEFSEKGCSDLRCPECPQELEYGDVQRLADEDTFAAYEKILTRNALAALAEFAWCLKGDECNSGQLNEDNNNFMDCQNCGYQQCLRCKVPWHTGETCDQYEYRTSGRKQKDEEDATEKMIDSISKRCPGKDCGWRIQKLDGCDHMTCKKCKWEFCWECLASHREIKRIGNTAHLKDCKFHSDNLETSWPFNMHA